VRVLRNGRLQERVKNFRQALFAGLALLLSGCAGGLSGAADDPLIPIADSNAAKIQTSRISAQRNADRNTLLVTPPEKRSADIGPETQFGSGEFIKEPSGAVGASVTGDDEVELNFSEANVREVAQSVLGTILGQNFVVDAGVEQRITLRTSRPIKKANLIPTLETTLAATGLALQKDGELDRGKSAKRQRQILEPR
jgi:general secretion pathway protein D